MKYPYLLGVFMGVVLTPNVVIAQLVDLPQISFPQMPHLPELRIPELRIPLPSIDIPIGHKTDKWEIRHNLESNGWWVAYGKELGYQDYYNFVQAVAGSVATENPAPAMAYLQALVAESIAVLSTNAGAEFGNKLRDVAQRELVSVFYDAMKNGRVRTIKLNRLEVQLGMATYNRQESFVPLPNTFQPYLRMRMTIDAPGMEQAKYHWVATVFNPTNTAVNYAFYSESAWNRFSVSARGWRWHSLDSATAPTFKVDFDMGPPAQHQHKEYHLNNHRLFIGTTPTNAKGEPYAFRFDAQKGWDLYRGKQ